MKDNIENYAKLLLDLKMDSDMVTQSRDVLRENKTLCFILRHPAIAKQEKFNVIDGIFNGKMRSFLKLLCENGKFESIFRIFDLYETLEWKQKNIQKVTFFYVKKPTTEQTAQIKQILCKKLEKEDIILELKEDASIIGGFVIKAENKIYDRSVRHSLQKLQCYLRR